MDKTDIINIASFFKNEMDLFYELLNQSEEYFEYGSGLSTKLATETKVKKITSVDTSIEWVNKTKENVTDSRVSIFHIDIGETGKWGRPLNSEPNEGWYLYQNAISKFSKNPDVVLIDGRFRVACIASTVIFCLEKNIRPKILLHDSVRECYSICYSFLKATRNIPSEMKYSKGFQVFEIPDELEINIVKKILKEYSNTID